MLFPLPAASIQASRTAGWNLNSCNIIYSILYCLQIETFVLVLVGDHYQLSSTPGINKWDISMLIQVAFNMDLTPAF